MLNRKQVIVEDYNPDWPKEFLKLYQYFKKNLTIEVPIEHVGSTSVIGLPAKPILDIVIVVRNDYEFEIVKQDLLKIGYLHVGDQGIRRREVFKLAEANNFFKHHLYVAYQNSLGLRNILCVRNHLQNNPIDKLAYGDLKKALAKQFSQDISAYIEGKTPLIISILKKYDFTDDEIEEIININKKA